MTNLQNALGHWRAAARCGAALIVRNDGNGLSGLVVNHQIKNTGLRHAATNNGLIINICAIAAIGAAVCMLVICVTENVL